MSEIFKELTNNKNAWLIDVRSQAEWAAEGVPVLINMEEGKVRDNNKNRVVLLSLYTSPNMELNPNFLKELGDMVSKHDDSSYYFLCRSAHRSAIAARLAQEVGYKNCYSIAFSGRGGWIELGLPVTCYVGPACC